MGAGRGVYPLVSNPVPQYCLGFCFARNPTTETEYVALIKKTKPSWQAGKLNGIGGKVEPNEMPFEAMIREFQEETGVKTTEGWHIFAQYIPTDSGLLDTAIARVFCYSTRMEWNQFCQIRTVTEEKTMLVEVSQLEHYPVLPNLHWLVPMALHFPRDYTGRSVICHH